jgi:hypothetical protein
MLSHPSFGFIWEQIVLSNVKGWYPDAEVFYYRTAERWSMNKYIDVVPLPKLKKLLSKMI